MNIQTTLRLIVCSAFLLTFLIACEDETPYWQGDITEKLKAKIAAGENINLPAGTYEVSSSIVSEGYSGTIKGAGKDLTIIKTAPGFKGEHDPYIGTVGTEKVAAIFSFSSPSGDIIIRDMTFDINGEAPAESHKNPLIDKIISTIDNVIVVSEGNSGEITASFINLKVLAEESEHTGAWRGKNVVWAFVTTAMNGINRVNMVVQNCHVANVATFSSIYHEGNLGSLEYTNNEVVNSYGGVYANEISTYSATNNEFFNLEEDAILFEGGSGCIMSNTLDEVAIADDCPQ